MFETTKIAPCYNGYQYIFIFVAAVILDAFIHFFSSRRYYGLKTDAFGFAPELMIYYRSLRSKGPFPIDGVPENFYGTCNSWLLGGFIAGVLSVFVLLVADLFLHALDIKYNL